MSNCVENNLYCNGCGSCFCICPTHAIRIELSPFGFYKPILDKTKCISCGKCLQICTKFKTNYPKSKDFTEFPLYAGWSLDKKTQFETSSGGIGFEIAKWAINNNYKVAGAIYDVKEETAKTVIASTLAEIEAFKGSKYLQSFSADTFKTIIESNDKFVVFGTPCQIAGLRMLAKKNNCEERLILVDFFCHGVPTHLLWKSFLKWLKEKKNITKITGIQFRNKKYGWHNFTMKIKTENKDYYLKMKDNPFYTLLFSNFLLNNACYLCNSKSSFYFADIRIGDFLGSTFDDREDGVSVISLFSDTGKIILDSLEKEKKIILIPQKHNICTKNQVSFNKFSFNSYQQKQLLLNLLKTGTDISKIEKEYLKFLPFSERIFLIIKNFIPNFIIRKLRKLYHYYKEKYNG